MPNPRSIELIDLLHRREEEFVTVWKCEQEIIRIMGMPDFPFAPPPDLPSLRPVTKGKGRPRTAKEAQVKGPTVRALRTPQENAYRLVFVYNGVRQDSFQTDQKLIETLMAQELTDFRLMAVETVSFRTLEDWDTCETLWERQQ